VSRIEKEPMWHQQNPRDDRRTAMAPYNFVPLPERVFRVDGDQGQRFLSSAGRPLWQCHDEFVPGTYSGWVDLKITTLTPLFIRGSARQVNGAWDKRESRVRSAPACDVAGRPIIPGSSLRGMLRSLVEILGFAKPQPVSRHRPFFRTVMPGRIGDAYRERVVRGNQKPRGGFIRREGADWTIVPSLRVLRVDHEKIPGMNYGTTPQYWPDWKLQHRKCWVTVDDHGNVNNDVAFEKRDGWLEGTLVLSGNAPRRPGGREKGEFVFLPPGAEPPIVIPDEMWTRFHDDDQLSGWQKKAFPLGRPAGAVRRGAGHLRDGEPVFYVRDEQGSLLFFGRAQLFRFPYDLSPAELVPSILRETGVDLAEAMFGRVAAAAGGLTIKSRIQCEDAFAEPRAESYLEEVIVPRILGAPKPTAFQQYLVQDGTRDKWALKTYFTGDATQIRGHKAYWHRWDEGRALEVVKETEKYETLRQGLMNGAAEVSTQHTIVQPVRRDVTFRGKIRFQNLTAIELGALMAALRLPAGSAHKLGMAKPLGLGSVAIGPALHLVSRKRRYATWLDDGVEGDVDTQSFERAFAETITAHATASRERFIAGTEGLWSIARLDSLRILLSFNDRPPLEETRYNLIQNGDTVRYEKANEYANLPVLPTPHGVVGRNDPWVGDHPPPLPTVSNAAPPGAANQIPHNRSHGGRAPQQRSVPVPPPRGPVELKAGERVLCRLTATKTNKGGQVWEIVGRNAEAVVHPSTKAMPDDLQVGSEIELIVKSPPTRQGRGQVAYEPTGVGPSPPARK